MIVYANLCGPDHHRNGLEKRMRQRFPKDTEYLHDLKALQKRLQDSIFDIDFMVIHVCSESPVPELLEIQNDLKEINIILIYNETATKDQIVRLLKLYPRYMTSDAADDTIISLLEQRLSHNHKMKQSVSF